MEIKFISLRQKRDQARAMRLPVKTNPIPAAKIAVWISARGSGTVITTIEKSWQSGIYHKFIKMKYS
jgi:hypothetical protein